MIFKYYICYNSAERLRNGFVTLQRQKKISVLSLNETTLPHHIAHKGTNSIKDRKTTKDDKMEKLKIFAKTIEEKAITQIHEMNESEAYGESMIRIMPDCHAGKGCTVGTVIKVEGRAVPNTVGVDIGCGMLVAEFKNLDLDLKRLDEVVNTKVPSGFNIHEQPVREFNALNDLLCHNVVEYEKTLCSIGSLGGGNHFIEVDKDDNGSTYIVIHSGSRNLGLKVCNYYQNVAANQRKDVSEEIRILVEKMKSEGRAREIPDELKKIKRPKVSKALAWLSGDKLSDYLHDMNIVQQYAQLNRETILDIICQAMDITPDSTFHTIHNYIDLTGPEVILRKGAVSAQKGEKLIIPMNMRDGSLLCTGKGNADWLCSAPHGAGRLMSRKAAHNTITLEEFESSMQGIYSTSVCSETIDESPMAYKPMQEIIECIHPTVTIDNIIRPVYNFKAKG